MSPKQFDISIRSHYSWTNLYRHAFVPCRKCSVPLLPLEFTPAISETNGKIVAARLPDRCSGCATTRKRAAKATASNVIELFPAKESS